MTRDEAAVSNVLGAILVFGLLVLTLVLVQVRFVPRWDEDREDRRSDAVLDQLTLLQADADRLARNATANALSQSLALAGGGGPTFFQGPPPQASASFAASPAASGVQVASPLLRILERDGEALYGIGEQWVPIPISGSLSGLTAVSHLRARVAQPNQEAAGDSATLTVRDASGAYAGKAVLTFLRDASERSLQVEVYSASSQATPITAQRESYFHRVEPAYVYANLLDDELLFGQVLAAASKPAALHFTNNGLNADYTATYSASGGGLAGAGGGVPVANYAVTIPSGTLAATLAHHQMPEQTYALEHGAILLSQPDGAAMVSPPSLTASSSATQTVLQWTLPALVGPDGALAGGDRVHVAIEPTGARSQVTGVAARLSLTIPTAFPQAWAQHLDDVLRAAGLSPTGPAPQFTVTQAIGSVHLTVFGPTSAPADASEDVVLRFAHAGLAVSLRPQG